MAKNITTTAPVQYKHKWSRKTRIDAFNSQATCSICGCITLCTKSGPSFNSVYNTRYIVDGVRTRHRPDCIEPTEADTAIAIMQTIISNEAHITKLQDANEVLYNRLPTPKENNPIDRDIAGKKYTMVEFKHMENALRTAPPEEVHKGLREWYTNNF